MPYTLPSLTYPETALEPWIDARTMEIHRGKHHATYVANLNNTLSGHPALVEKPLESLFADLSSIPLEIRTAVRNNGGGHWNHSFYWESMAPCAAGPTGALAAAIDKEFGGLPAFQEKFQSAAAARFGSGWGWLVVRQDKSLAICSTPNQDNPLMRGVAETEGTPLLCVDVWEHAYYLLYQNRRADYLKAWWNVVNWAVVLRRYEAAIGS